MTNKVNNVLAWIVIISVTNFNYIQSVPKANSTEFHLRTVCKDFSSLLRTNDSKFTVNCVNQLHFILRRSEKSLQNCCVNKCN